MFALTETPNTFIGWTWPQIEPVAPQAAHLQRPFLLRRYGLAQLGAVQVWLPFPQLCATAGATFAADPSTLAAAIALVEEHLARLDPACPRTRDVAASPPKR